MLKWLKRQKSWKDCKGCNSSESCQLKNDCNGGRKGETDFVISSGPCHSSMAGRGQKKNVKDTKSKGGKGKRLQRQTRLKTSVQGAS